MTLRFEVLAVALVCAAVPAAADEWSRSFRGTIGNRHVEMELDEEGLTELSEVLRSAIEAARDINTRAGERRAAGNGAASIATELAILHYERRP